MEIKYNPNFQPKITPKNPLQFLEWLNTPENTPKSQETIFKMRMDNIINRSYEAERYIQISLNWLPIYIEALPCYNDKQKDTLFRVLEVMKKELWRKDIQDSAHRIRYHHRFSKNSPEPVKIIQHELKKAFPDITTQANPYNNHLTYISDINTVFPIELICHENDYNNIKEIINYTDFSKELDIIDEMTSWKNITQQTIRNIKNKK